MNPTTTKTLVGFVVCSRALAEHKIWLAEPFNIGAAFWDLVLLANDKPSTFYINGAAINVERGQLAWSFASLAKRWKWGREKVAARMRWMQAQQMITMQEHPYTTITTVTNYESYQDVIKFAQDRQQVKQQPDINSDNNPGDKSDNNPATTPTQKEKENKNTPPTGEVPVDLPTVDEVAFVARSAGIPERWALDWLAQQFRRPKQDFPHWSWRDVMALNFRADLLARHPKATGIAPTEPAKNFAPKKFGRRIESGDDNTIIPKPYVRRSTTPAVI